MFYNFYQLDSHNKTTKHGLHLQIYDETHAKIGLKIWTSIGLVMIIGSACLCDS